MSRTRGQTWRNTVTWNRQLAHDAALEIKLGTDYGHRDVDTVWQEDHARGELLSQRLTRSRYSDSATTLSGKYSYPYTDRHQLSAGWDVSDARRRKAHSDITSTTAQAATLATPQDFHANVRRMAWFAQDEWRRSKSVSLYAGARWEAVDTGNRGTGFAAANSRFRVLSPILQ